MTTHPVFLDVASLQRSLIAAGFDILADGLYGPATDQALTAFMRGEKGTNYKGPSAPTLQPGELDRTPEWEWRDRFAMQALMGLLAANPDPDFQEIANEIPDGLDAVERYSWMAYRFADAMLEARKHPEETETRAAPVGGPGRDP